MPRPAFGSAGRAGLLVAGAALGLFVVLAILVVTGSADAFDNAVRSAIHSWATPALTAVSRALSHLGSVAVLVVLCALSAIALWLLGRRDAALSLAVTLGATMLVNTALKLGFQRVRPTQYFGDVLETYSFPSGHSAFSCCFYLGAAVILAGYARTKAQRAAIFAVAAALIAGIGFSRVYLGVHYPSDVAGGYLVAIAGVAAAHVVGGAPVFTPRNRRP